MNRIITLLTDFGCGGPYVATMKGVMLSLNPGVQIVDVSHEIQPQNVREAAFCIAAVQRYFPAGTIHVTVVDPGVGSARRLLCMVMHDQLFLAPDNGLLSWTARAASTIRAFELSDARFWRNDVSATFHGRDILAPVAAHLSLGVAPEQLGAPVHDWVPIPWPSPVRTERGVVAGEVISVDPFGNLISNIAEADLGQTWETVNRVICAAIDVGRVARCYADVREGELIALVGSHGLLEIAVRNGNAAQRLGALVGAPVELRLISN